MKLKYLLLLLLSIPAFVFAQKKTYLPDQQYSIVELQEDFRVLQMAFENEHPAWGKYHPADSMKAWFESTAQQINRPMTELEFRRLLYPLIARLGCGHSRIKTPKSYQQYSKKNYKEEQIQYLLPFQAQKIQDRLVVLYAFTPDSSQLLPGTEILAINGLPAAKVMADVESMFPSDGYNQTHKERVLNLDFNSYYHFYYGDQKKYKLRIQSPKGDLQQLELPAYMASVKTYQETLKNKKPKTYSSDSILFKKKYYQLRLLDNDKQTAALQIKSFKGKKGIRFYHKVFRYLDRENIHNLVIDLRDNGGGDGKEAMTLVSYINDTKESVYGQKKKGKPAVDKYLLNDFNRKIWAPIFLPLLFKTRRDSTFSYMGIEKKPRRKYNFDGTVFLIENGLSFSSSVIAAAYLLKGERVFTIGQESGGGQKGTNAFQMPRLRLPHTRIEMVYPRYAIYTDIEKPDRGRGVFPDYPIEYTLEDILEGKDLELEKVRELAKEMEKN